MNATFEHPSLKMPVTAEQRERAEQWLQEAYADGRISETEFDHRIGQVISANNRKELNQAFFGLVEPRPEMPRWDPRGTGAANAWSSPQPYRGGSGYFPVPQQQSTAPGALAHFSGLFTWIVGPGAVYVMSRPGSISRREAAKAFNFQLIAGLVGIIGLILTNVAPWDILDFVMPLLTIGWLVGTIVGGAKAAQGADWKNPVKSVIKLDVLPEK